MLQIKPRPKPCPFCGERQGIKICRSGVRYGRCEACCAKGPIAYSGQKEAATLWNTRITEEGKTGNLKKKNPDKCRWVHDDIFYKWSGTCGIVWELIWGTPKENGVRFCPRCGKRIKALK